MDRNDRSIVVFLDNIHAPAFTNRKPEMLVKPDGSFVGRFYVEKRDACGGQHPVDLPFHEE